jgi:hypothetical protein
MFLSLCRRLWDRVTVPSGGKHSRGGRHHSCRPRLEPLEDRTLPAGWAGAALASAPIPAGARGLPQPGGMPQQGTTPICVTVDQDTPETVIDLGAAFATARGLQHGDGLKLAVLSNTNSGLVSTDLSEAALTLTYARGKCGVATINVGATDADGVSVQQTFLVTVRPLQPAGAVRVTPLLVPLPAGPVRPAPLPTPLPAPLAPRAAPPPASLPPLVLPMPR